MKQKRHNDQIYSMVEKIIDILQSNMAENNDNYLAVNHVRDMLIPPQERKRKRRYETYFTVVLLCFSIGRNGFDLGRRREIPGGKRIEGTD